MTGPLGKYRTDPVAAAEPQTPRERAQARSIVVNTETPVPPATPEPVPPAEPAAWTQAIPATPAEPATPAPAPATPEPTAAITLAQLMKEIETLRAAQAEQLKAVEEKAARDLAAADEAAGIRLWPDENGFRCIGKTNARGDWEPVQALESAVILQEIQIPAKMTDPVWPARVIVAVKGHPPETVARSLTTILKIFTDADWLALRDTVRDCRSAEREQEYQELRAERGSKRGQASAASRRKY